MRELKFRIWQKNQNTWCDESFYISPNGKWIMQEGNYENIHHLNNGKFIVQQFTGVKDSDEKEIFEGDIVNVKFRKCGEQICEIKYDTMGFECFLITKEEPSFPMCIKDIIIKIKVIGNIFENPELLK